LGWDTVHITIKALGAGSEETAVLGLISPPPGTPHLRSVIGNIGGVYTLSFSFWMAFT
jgi:xyloglucan-specific exo-beta-1,4-glucanase